METRAPAKGSPKFRGRTQSQPIKTGPKAFLLVFASKVRQVRHPLMDLRAWALRRSPRASDSAQHRVLEALPDRLPTDASEWQRSSPGRRPPKARTGPFIGVPRRWEPGRRCHPLASVSGRAGLQIPAPPPNLRTKSRFFLQILPFFLQMPSRGTHRAWARLHHDASRSTSGSDAASTRCDVR